MVKVREEHPITESGEIDIDKWLHRIQEKINLPDIATLKKACELSLHLEQEAVAAQKIWSEGANSFLTGLEMAEILADLKLDQGKKLRYSMWSLEDHETVCTWPAPDILLKN